MLNTGNAGIDRFLDRDLERHVAGERKVKTSCFLGDREERVTRREVVNLDKVDATVLQKSNGRACVLSGLHTHPERPSSRRIVENRTGSNDPRAEDASRGGRFPRCENPVQIRPHIADARDAIGDVKGKPSCFAALDVRVHIPETGDQELTLTIDNLHASRGSLISCDACDR